MSEEPSNTSGKRQQEAAPTAPDPVLRKTWRHRTRAAISAMVDTKFKKDLIKIVVDRLLIAGILLLVSFYVSRLLERYRSDLSFQKELNVVRAERIGSVWENIYLAEATTDEIMEGIVEEARKQDALRTKLQNGQIDQKEYLAEMNASGNKISELSRSEDQQLTSLSSIIERNRFWLGERQYLAIRGYLSTFLVVVPVDGRAFDSYRKDVERVRVQRRVHLDQIRDDILMGRTADHIEDANVPGVSPPALLRKIP